MYVSYSCSILTGKRNKRDLDLITFSLTLTGVTGKYYSDGAETAASEEANDEEKQKKLWELSGG